MTLRAAGTLIGAATPRHHVRRFVEGRGCYTDDIRLSRIAHITFVRSPYGNARFRTISIDAAARMPGVIAVVTAADLTPLCTPFDVHNDLFPAMRTVPQWPLAVDHAAWQGEAVAAVVGSSRALAEDAAEKVEIDWEELPSTIDPVAALLPDAPLVHDELGTNLVLAAKFGSGDLDARFREAEIVIEDELLFGRHTGMCLEPRSILASFEPADRMLSVWQSHQVPSQLQDIYARHLNLPEHHVHVICPDVGGGFGLKQQAYADELAVCAIAVLLGRPVKFIADRLESFLSDSHAREHRVKAAIAVRRDGTFAAMRAEDTFAIGAYSQYPRSSVGEGVIAMRIMGGPYRLDAYSGDLKIVHQNKSLVGHYRAVGHPIGCAVTEHLVDRAARAIGVDPFELRRRNYIAAGDNPYRTPTGLIIENLSFAECQEKLEALLDLASSRTEQAALRAKGIYRGIGAAAFVELTATGPGYYGPAGIRATSQDGCFVKLEPSGVVRCVPSVTEQGQGTDSGIAQIVAATLGVPIEAVRVLSGDTAFATHGGGAWASRGIAIGGVAALRAAAVLKANLLKLAGAIMQRSPDSLDIAEATIIDAGTAAILMPLGELARIGYFRQDTLPPGLQPELAAVGHYFPSERPFLLANGIQGSVVEVDLRTGFVKLLRHIVVHDCGTIINPLLVEEQIRGGVVQGIGAALFEELIYGEGGQLLNGSLADYLVPLASEMPDIEVAHICHGAAPTELGAKGVGEAGTTGAAAAVLNAINDALAPLGTWVTQMPCTPARIIEAIERTGTKNAAGPHDKEWIDNASDR